ncbi:MAG: sulfite exporter TauE/SafE family protein [Candidatus Omnitrophica bacterium]|nr:sulfite exporter TauE/SafE family protein [Candidatus Omnitrophota bacterium]
MILGLTPGFIAGIIILAFILEYMDSTLGMGYGTTLTPVLLMMGYEPLQIVPVVLISELITGISAGFFHHREGNVNFQPKLIVLSEIKEELKSFGYIKSFNRNIPKHLKVAMLLAVCSIVGTVFSIFIAVNIPKFWVKIYIGTVVLMMGIIITICRNKEFKFSWQKIVGLGLVASFNKGISGGGYGPLVTSGQILSGVEGKSAVGITSLAEGLTCAVGIISYMLMTKTPLDLKIAPFIIIGAVASVPFSAKSVKKLSEKKLKMAIAAATIILGLWTLKQTIFG